MDEPQALICAYLLDSRGGGRALSWPDLTPGADAAQSPVWIHLERTAPEAVRWLRESASLDPLVCDALLAEETRPRAEVIGPGLLVILRGVNLNPGADPDDMVSLRMWADERRVITLRHRKVAAIHDMRDAIERADGPTHTGAFLVRLAALLIDRMQTAIDGVDDALADLEELLAAGQPSDLRQRLAAVRRQAIAFRRYIAPQREAMTRLVGAPVPWLTDRDRARLREDADRLTRYVEELDAARERAIVMHEELMARVAERMNRAMYVLSIVAGVFLPLGLITGLLGINVGGIPGSDNPVGFLVVCALLLLLALAQLWLFRRFRWI